MGKVTVFGVWASPYSRRVEIALKMKGVEYEYVEEDLKNKSEELLKYNPIHKKIPVLVHDGKAIAESLVIMEYIDETWKGDPLLPTDPHERAQARFWAKFIDDKLIILVRTALMSQGEESEKAITEVEELLKFIEKEIKGKKFFGGNHVGFLDIVASILAFWIPCLQEVVAKEVLTREKYPAICTWIDELLGCSIIKHALPDKEKLKAFNQARFAKMNAKATN